MNKNLNIQTKKWRDLLQRILDVIIFLGERGLAFHGHVEEFGNPHNGNFLGLIELLSHYDPILKEHVMRISKSHEEGKKLQAHYLSAKIQNEFIHLCGEKVRSCVLAERESAKYYSIMVDATPDISCQEQSTFVFRYVLPTEDGYVVKERFFVFVNDNGKKGKEIAELIVSFLKDVLVPLQDCRGQGYDNASNMSGKYNGTQALMIEKNPLILYSPCGCHSLNLCGNDAAKCCMAAVTFFGMVQTVYVFFRSSPK